MSATPTDLDVAWVFDRYEAVRGRLPKASFPGATAHAKNLLALADRFDVFLLDAFGVLNVGDTPIPGAPQTIAALRAAGKALLVLTNGASLEASDALAKYRHFGFQFEPRELISSRGLLHAAIAAQPPGRRFGVAAPARSKVAQLSPRAGRLLETPALYDQADIIVLLSTDGWGEAEHVRLLQALELRPRPVLVGNPDVVSPREDGFKLEPGHYAHAVAESTGIEPEFYGKPFANAFDEVRKRLDAMGRSDVPAERIAMVGDTLHTDILGGAAAGFRTVLVNNHGLFAGVDPARFIERSGIVPDFVVETT